MRPRILFVLLTALLASAWATAAKAMPAREASDPAGADGKARAHTAGKRHGARRGHRRRGHGTRRSHFTHHAHRTLRHSLRHGHRALDHTHRHHRRHRRARSALFGLPPVLTVHHGALHWTAAGRRHLYRILASEPGRRPSFSTVAHRTTVRPPSVSGETVTYRVRAAYQETDWSNPVTITYPMPRAEAETEAQRESQASSVPPAPGAGESPDAPASMTVALDTGGWGPSAWPDIAGAAKAVRLSSRFASDAEVGAAANAGVTVASWLVGSGGTISAIEPAAYAAEVVSLFKRYGKGGTFWRGRPDLGGQNVEVLNEPNNYVFWSDPTDFAAYANLLRVVHEALVANFPAAIRPRVLASWDGGEGPSSPFGPGWAALGALPYVDGVTVHPYEGSSGAHGPLGGEHDVEQAHAASGKPVYVTEIGWPTAVGQPPTGDSRQSTEAQQAENITNFFGWARSTGYVKLAVYFNYVDYGSNTWYGIERQDRSHKLGYAALAHA